MTPRLPRLARWLLRLSLVPREARDEMQADLHELFEARRRERGGLHAHWRLYHDVASLSIPRSPIALLRDARGDLRYAARLFARQPGVVLLTVVGLSLGLGIATAAFSIMNAATLRGEGLIDSDHVPAIIRTTDRSESTTWTYEEFLHLREGSTRMQVEAILTDAAQVRTTSAEADAPASDLAFVSGGFFAATGGRTVAGRPLERGDEDRAGPPPVVISFAFWTSRLNQDPVVVGRTIRVGRTEATIVGVAEQGFTVPHRRQLWMPLTAYGAVYEAAPVDRAPSTGLQVFGRLLPEAALPEAEAQLSGTAAALRAGESPIRARLDSNVGLGRASSPEILTITLLVLAVIGLVLVLACANVATVLVAAAITREREMGVRAALGASRSRIVRQLVTESLALGALSAALGLLFAWWGIPIIGTMIQAPAGTDLTPDLTVYLFLGIVTVFTGVAAGLAPARHCGGADLLAPLKGESRQNRLAPRRLRSTLVMTQAAASMLLIVLASLFIRATFHAATVDVGFDTSGLYAVSPGRDVFADDGAANRRFWSRAIPDLASIPGVRTVALSEFSPFGGLTRTAITREEPARTVNFAGTRAGYFETMGLRVLAGRTYTSTEVASGARVAVVSESLARAYWPGRSPLGEMLPREIPVAGERPVVIGVVDDAITGRLHERNALAVYEPLTADGEKFAQILLRVGPGGTGAIDQASQRLRAMDPQADVRIESVAARVQQEAGRPGVLATLTGSVGAIAIVLCVIGLYGLTASVVGQRTREMGIRAAMGAERGDLLRLVLRDSLRPVAIGLAAGAGFGLLASRAAAATMLFGVSPRDPLAFAGAAIILLAAATLAVAVPARRAAAVDAAFVLRQS